jgi:hypothetical protein
VILTPETAIVKCGSHRARHKLFALVGKENAEAFYSFDRNVGTGGVYRIPREHAAKAKTITGISGFRDGDDLAPCWTMTPIRELLHTHEENNA